METAATTTGVNGAERKRRWAGLALLVSVAIGVPVAAAYLKGAMAIPRLDDWAFGRVAFGLYSTGRIHLVGWGEMTLVGHELWSLPFIASLGRNFTALHWAAAAAGVISLVAAFSLFRRFVSWRLALAGAAAVGALPTFAVLTTAYMTDLTGYAGEVGCLALGLGAMRPHCKRPKALLGASMVVGFWAFACRESSIAAPVAVMVGYLVTERRRGRPLRNALLVGAAFVIAATVFYRWREALPHGQPTPFSRPGLLGAARAALVLMDSYFTVALGALPILALASRRALREAFASRGALITGFGVGLVGAALIVFPHYPLKLPTTVLVDGTALSQFGAEGVQQASVGGGIRMPLIPDAIWLLINVLAVIGGALLAAIAWHAVTRRRSAGDGTHPARERLPSDILVILLYGGVSAGVVALRAATNGFLFDRYLIGLTTAVGVLVLRWLGARGAVAARRGVLALLLMGALSVVIVLDGDSYDRARWAVGEAAVARGVPPQQISAGFEWLGAHHPSPIGSDEKLLGFPDRCVVLSMAALKGSEHELLEVRHYAPLGHFLERKFWVYREPALCPR